MDINKTNYTEEELKELFKKLEKIGELCGVNVSVNEQSDEDKNKKGVSSARIGEELILMSPVVDDAQPFYLYVEDNILPKYNIQSLPRILTAYMHELSHLLTMAEDDLELYWNNYNDYFRRFGLNWYFELPYELLATNLGIKLVSENYDVIMSILMGEDINIEPSIIARNLNIAKDMKSEYIIN